MNITKPSFSIVFVVLVYRNTKDLKDFFESNIISNSKTIVINSYFDEESEKAFKQIAKFHNADFISVPNKGYGAGNNRGIEYALENYDFEYLIISNADITIRQLDISSFSKTKVIAPKIITLRGKNQNPSSPFSPSKIKDYFLYRIYHGNHNKLIRIFWAYSRINKIVYYAISRFRKKIFAPHGAFIIIPKRIIKECLPLFNEKMFLFNEESHLGMLLKEKGFETEYNPSIIIDHKEDGSVALLNDSLFKLHRQSFLEFYEYWRRK